MSLNIRPMLSALRRNPTGAVLVSLQVAITLAVLVNATWIVSQRIAQIEQPTGIDTRDTFGMIIGGLSNQFNAAAAQAEDLAYLDALPGVAAAAASVGIPLTGMGSWNTQFWRQPGQRGITASSNIMSGDSQALLRALEVPLASGRNFRADELRPASGKSSRPPSEVILTRALAGVLFPHGGALGKTIYDPDGNPMTVIGITRDFIGVSGHSGASVYQTALVPSMPGQSGFYALLVRAQPGRRDGILHAAQQHIGAAHRDGVLIETIALEDAKHTYDSDNRNMAIFLTIVTTLMLVVCCLGIFGLATFNVGSRTRQIGTRRAVGARRGDIVTHFLVESALILAAGALLGSVLALVIGDWLTVHYGLPRLDPVYLLTAVAVLCIIGQLAAWQPARRAASVPPSVATRTV